MQRNRLIAALAATALTALLVAAATSAGGRRDRETRVEKAGLSSDSVRPAEFPAGMPKVAGDPTRGDRKWAAKDQRDRAARRDRRDGDRRNGGSRATDCNCWDQYPQTANIDLKVLLMTGYAQDPPPQFLKARDIQILHKPFNLEKLCTLAQEMVA